MSSIIERNESMCVEGKKSWMDPNKAYVRNNTLPEERKATKKVKKWLSLFYLENDGLYKWSFSMPLLMCLTEEEANYVVRELHERIYTSHATGASLALKALRNGYFWPIMKANALNIVKTCDKC